MRALRPVSAFAVLTALTVLPAVASAQYPGGGGYGGGRPAGSRTSPNGLPETSSLEPKTDAGPKSEELVDLKPILRGIKLQPTQDSTIKAIRDRYDPQLLPMYDWLRDQMVKKQKGQEVDMTAIQKRFERVDALRKKEIDEIRAVMSADQLVRLNKNVEDEHEADLANASRQEVRRDRQRQRPPA